MINWKRKLTIRKFWAAVAWSLIGYITGEGIADGKDHTVTTGIVTALPIDDETDEPECGADGCTITYHDEEVM